MRETGDGEAQGRTSPARSSEEPDRIRRRFEVQTVRLEPVGIVYLWPDDGLRSRSCGRPKATESPGSIDDRHGRDRSTPATAHVYTHNLWLNYLKPVSLGLVVSPNALRAAQVELPLQSPEAQNALLDRPSRRPSPTTKTPTPRSRPASSPTSAPS